MDVAMFQGLFKHERSRAFLQIFEERASAFLLQLNDLCFAETETEKEQQKKFLIALNEIASWDDETIQKERNAIYSLNPDMNSMYNFVLKYYVDLYFKGTPSSTQVQTPQLQELPTIEDFIRAFYVAISKDNGIRKGAIFEMESHKAQFIFMNAIRKALWSILKVPLSKINSSGTNIASSNSNHSHKSSSVTALTNSQPKSIRTIQQAHSVAAHSVAAHSTTPVPGPDAVFKNYVNETIAVANSSTGLTTAANSSTTAATPRNSAKVPSLTITKPPSVVPSFKSIVLAPSSKQQAPFSKQQAKQQQTPAVVPSVASVSIRAPASSSRKTPHTVHSFIPSATAAVSFDHADSQVAVASKKE